MLHTRDNAKVDDTKRDDIVSSTKDSFNHFNPYDNSLGGYEEKGGAYIDDVYYIPDDSGYREPL